MCRVVWSDVIVKKSLLSHTCFVYYYRLRRIITLTHSFGFPKICLLSIRSYEARMIMYARALYRSFKVKWIGKVYFPTRVLFIINTVIRGAQDNVRTCVIQ